ncbi:GroES-like protein [Acephala macrosclerotiorum]|nr:GroES-like protein [Acephala macrosclerotiorum]
MKALGVTTFGKPSNLKILTLPDPTIEGPDDIIVSVKAISINPADYFRMSGITRFIEPLTFVFPSFFLPIFHVTVSLFDLFTRSTWLTRTRLPFTIAADFSGTIHSVGSNVTKFKKGDSVYGFCIHVHGVASQLLHLTPLTRHFISHIPLTPNHEPLTFESAAAIPTVSCTAINALWQADCLIAEKESGGTKHEGGLKDKTVFVIAGLGGVGNIALQVLKSCFGVKKVITTVSTSKIPLITSLLGEGKVDSIVDYTKGQNEVVETIGKEKVDFLFDTVGQGMPLISVVKKGGLILSIKGKSSTTLKADIPNAPFWICWLVDLHLAVNKWRTGRWGVEYDHTYAEFSERFGDKVRELVEEGKLKMIVGRVVEFEKGEEGQGRGLEEVKAILEIAGKGKGAVGKMLVKLDGLGD